MDNTVEKEIRLSDLFRHIKPFLRFFLSRLLLMLLAIALGIGLGLVYYYKQKPRFESVCTFMIEDKQPSMGGLGGIASQFGFDLGGLSGGGSLFSGENIFEILRSKRIVNKVLLSKVDSVQPAGMTLADLYLTFSDEGKKIRKKPQLASVNFNSVASSLTPLQDTVLNIIYNKIVKKSLIVDRVSKRGNLTKVQIDASDRKFAILMSQRIVEEAMSLYVHIKVGNAKMNISRMQVRADSLLMLLNGKYYSAAVAQTLDANPGIASSRVPAELALRDRGVISTLYSEVVKNLEASKMLLSQQTPVIEIIDYPSISTEDNLVSPVVTCFIGVFALSFLAFVTIFVQYLIRYKH
ncbi:hypothetical protein LZZ85_17345 [Terrimonas sp. NA20]|uniref:Polysaccharide chain length determinant N-terminal domain-containing protein n=1 Tax=Terrimonas ginsenosidimutans TaxID=2908004 RepID=A0ABS9KUT6_9BACT|nr:hypothetical protein [Terrimonas ginsenosidimutans]MCG2616065.1 hypothetical protein [Terrimonas ginsenosidimutans]